MEPVNQIPNPQVTPQLPVQSGMNLVLLGVIVLLLVLLGLSFSQVLSLRQQIERLETVAPEPTPAGTDKSTASVAPAPIGSTNEPVEIVGLIQRSEVEGGCWYIQPELPECTGDKCPLNVMGVPANYEPLNLPKELQKTGLKAKFKLEVQSGTATTCQLGPAVKILEYQILK